MLPTLLVAPRYKARIALKGKDCQKPERIEYRDQSEQENAARKEHRLHREKETS